MRKLKLLQPDVAKNAITRPILAKNRRISLLFAVLPLLGLLCFGFLYFWAAHLYPQEAVGSPAAAGVRGYQHTQNYLCDLFAENTRSGMHNPGWLVARIAGVILPLSLVPLFWDLPLLFLHEGNRARPAETNVKVTQIWSVRIFGSVAFLLATVIFSPLHDVSIVVGFPLAFVAFVLALINLWKAQRRGLSLLGLWPLGVGLVNFMMWQSAWQLQHMPLVQKAAFVGLGVWVVAVCVALLKRVSTLEQLESE